MKISIIVPVYQVEKYIEESIKSIVNQSFDKNDYEIIIVNDGTKDNSIKFAENILLKSKCNYRIINQENRGLPSARNTGIKYSSGDYICFIDSDDIITNDHISDLYYNAINNNYYFTFTTFENVNVNCRFGCKKRSSLDNTKIDIDTLKNEFLNRHIKIHACATLVNRKFLYDNALQFNEKLRYGEDVEWLWRILSIIDSVGYINNYSYKYLIRSDSIMTSNNIERLSIFYEEFEKTIKNIQLDNNLKNKIISRVLLGSIHSFAKHSKFQYFSELVSIVDMDKLKYLNDISDYKAKILYFILFFSKTLFWLTSKVF